MNSTQNQKLAQICMSSSDLTADIEFFINLGFKLDSIFPADNPTIADMHGYNCLIRLDMNSSNNPPTLLLESEFEKPDLIAPNGARIIRKVSPIFKQNKIKSNTKFILTSFKQNSNWHTGRAGMLYRDLIPSRLSGQLIASHIQIPIGGPVPDMIHYHQVDFQLIYCYKGWVKVVYEDQGKAIILKTGDCVTQPPEIRHRVLEASDQLEVIEIGLPASHMTYFDHKLALPTANILPKRKFSDQTFCHHIRDDKNWNRIDSIKLEFLQTNVIKHSNNIASVQTIRPSKQSVESAEMKNQANILFYFVLSGQSALSLENQSYCIVTNDSFIIPSKSNYKFENMTSDLELLEIQIK